MSSHWYTRSFDASWTSSHWYMESQDLHQCLVPILSHPPILTSFPSYLPILVSFIRQHRPAFCKNHSTLIATVDNVYYSAYMRNAMK
eukprot:1137033-Amorphochlora_amoeboformis.AAC.1